MPIKVIETLTQRMRNVYKNTIFEKYGRSSK